MYTDKIMQLFANPKNVGAVKGANGIGEATNSFGEVVKLTILVEDGVIVDAKFKAYGSVVILATASVITTYIKNKPIEDIMQLTNDTIFDLLGGEIDKDKMPSFEVVKDALFLAIKKYKDKFED